MWEKLSESGQLGACSRDDDEWDQHEFPDQTRAEITAFDPRITDMRSGSGLSCRTSDKPTCANITLI